MARMAAILGGVLLLGVGLAIATQPKQETGGGSASEQLAPGSFSGGQDYGANSPAPIISFVSPNFPSASQGPQSVGVETKKQAAAGAGADLAAQLNQQLGAELYYGSGNQISINSNLPKGNLPQAQTFLDNAVMSNPSLRSGAQSTQGGGVSLNNSGNPGIKKDVVASVFAGPKPAMSVASSPISLTTGAATKKEQTLAAFQPPAPKMSVAPPPPPPPPSKKK